MTVGVGPQRLSGAGYESEGRKFESCRARQRKPRKCRYFYAVLLQSYLRHRSSSGLHHAELLECYLGAHSVLDGLPHQVLLLHLLQSPAEHLLFSSARDHAYSIKVAKDDVSRHHPYPTDLQRHSEVYDLCARRLILGVSSVGRSEEHTSELQSRQYLVC